MNSTISSHNNRSDACMIWLHGLGADSSDMAGLAPMLPLQSNIEHIFLDAPYRAVTINAGMRMRAWYDITGFDFKTREDEQGIQESAQTLIQTIDQTIKSGYQAHQIFVAGFSQGGAIALYAALHYPRRLAGVISLSAYLPLVEQCQALMPRETPLFIAYGERDNIVLPMFSEYTLQWLHQHSYQNVSQHRYPMMHEICAQEIQELARWIEYHIKRTL